MLHQLQRFVRDEHGEDLIEYGLLAAFAATVMFAVIITDANGLKTGVFKAFQKAKSALANV